jgi:hypothetical protein
LIKGRYKLLYYTPHTGLIKGRYKLLYSTPHTAPLPPSLADLTSSDGISVKKDTSPKHSPGLRSLDQSAPPCPSKRNDESALG